MWIVAGSLYPKLPAKIPLHFNLSGVPDSYGPPNFSNWFLLPVIATLLAVFLLGISALIPFLLRFAPEIVNISRKRELLALPADAQRRAINPDDRRVGSHRHPSTHYARNHLTTRQQPLPTVTWDSLSNRVSRSIFDPYETCHTFRCIDHLHLNFRVNHAR